jgi:hypothetical protein
MQIIARSSLLMTALFLLAGAAIGQVKSAKPKPKGTPPPKMVSGSSHGCGYAQAFEYDGITYQNTVTDDTYKGVPGWRVGKAEPPLSLNRVVRIAQKYLHGLQLPDEPKIVQGVSIMRVCDDNWAYAVTFLRGGEEKVAQISPTEQRVLGKQFYIYIRPNGSVIKPVPR